MDAQQYRFMIEQFSRNIQANSGLRQNFDEDQLAIIRKVRTPRELVWHHEVEKGRITLVERVTHKRTAHTGGRCFWGNTGDATPEKNKSRGAFRWEFVKPLKDPSLIDAFEEKVGFHFPQSFRECVMHNNAGYPSRYLFMTDKNERVLDFLLSFNPEDQASVWNFYEWSEEDFTELGSKYVQFADSCFGDPIAFDPKTGHVIFVDHETLEIEVVAQSFEDFLEKLYAYNDEPEEPKQETSQTPAKCAEEKSAPKKAIFRFPFFGRSK